MILTSIFTFVLVFLLPGISLQNPLTWNYLEPSRHKGQKTSTFFFVDEKYGDGCFLQSEG